MRQAITLINFPRNGRIEFISFSDAENIYIVSAMVLIACNRILYRRLDVYAQHSPKMIRNKNKYSDPVRCDEETT